MYPVRPMTSRNRWGSKDKRVAKQRKLKTNEGLLPEIYRKSVEEEQRHSELRLVRFYMPPIRCTVGHTWIFFKIKYLDRTFCNCNGSYVKMCVSLILIGLTFFPYCTNIELYAQFSQIGWSQIEMFCWKDPDHCTRVGDLSLKFFNVFSLSSSVIRLSIENRAPCIWEIGITLPCHT